MLSENWIVQNRDIREGEIIRFKTKKDTTYYLYNMERAQEKREKAEGNTISISIVPDTQYSKPDTYLYGVAKGGFGMSIRGMGNAIFVRNVSDNLQETKENRAPYSARWERHWGIELLEDDTHG